MNSSNNLSIVLHHINIIRNNTGKENLDNLNPDDRLAGDLNLDSLDLAELTVLIESKCGIDIFKDGIVATVQDVLNKLPNE